MMARLAERILLDFASRVLTSPTNGFGGRRLLADSMEPWEIG